MQEQVQTEKKTTFVDSRKLWFSMLQGAGLTVALLFMYVPDYITNDELFSELNCMAKDREFITESIKSITTESYDPKVLDIIKIVPVRTTSKKGVTYVEKGFSRFAERLPRWSLAVIIIDAAILFTLVTIVVRRSRKITCTSERLEHEKSPYLIYEVMLFIIAFFCLILPNIILFDMKGATIALAGFYTALSTWSFHLQCRPYYIQFKVTKEGPIDKEKCKMMAEYYSKLLSFVLGIFSVVTIGLVWYVSQLLTETSVLIPKLLNYQLFTLFLNDTYGSAWLLLVIAKQLVRNYFDIIGRSKN